MNNEDESAEFDPIALQNLRDAAKALPREVAPSAEAWGNILNRIESNRVRVLVPASDDVRARNENRWQSRSLWGAAAVLLVVASIATIRKLGNRESAQTQVTTTPTTQIENPSTVSVVFERYDVAAKDLAQNLEQRRAQMDPATTAVIDTCLQKIDSAIAEARTSLSESPNDATIAGLLTAAYEQKLDLLRRAEELPLRSL